MFLHYNLNLFAYLPLLILGVYSCENDVTLGELKKDLGFKGWVMSDWGATHSLSLLQGLDQEMPGSDFFGTELTQKVADGATYILYAYLCTHIHILIYILI